MAVGGLTGAVVGLNCKPKCIFNMALIGTIVSPLLVPTLPILVPLMGSVLGMSGITAGAVALDEYIEANNLFNE